ncbi:carbohydrate ABC transporter permease [Micromonospora avicenniae]|uniref:Carbohydrate ABC transporter membrane protein 2, CUT1 family n=1 Tax=Micromonospora avicenniae TaxID=1198245 RepID=A0A1N6ZM42_9ACTN|nr:carbohydrate ABC transporter permease [Micromonospora avicenniae]SIR27973.1 carbohydrate ABC transporter membrane protein 2, CUT1 family [Micromonospora avicenniae]
MPVGTFRRAGSAMLVVLIAVSVLFPLAWMAIAGFKGKDEVLRSPFQFFPDMWRWSNYTAILKDHTFTRAMIVTFVGALIFTVLSLVVNSMAAYAFARLEFRGKRFWWVYCIMPMFIPTMAILLTSFVVVSKLGMLNTMAVLIIPGVASAAQMFFLRQYYLNFPIAVEEAAMIDGANRWQVFLRVFLPQSAAPFVVVGIASYLAYWNAYVWPILTITDPSLTQIMQFLGTFRSDRGNDWGMLMAGSTLASLPTVLLLLIFQRYIVNGVRISGMK